MHQVDMSVNQRALLAELADLRRDIVSDGFDAALELLCGRFPIRVHQYASGTPCWTWRIPEKWTCDEAYVETASGARIIDQCRHPLHVASHSRPVDKWVSREELLAHLHVHPHFDDLPPFVFYYYQPNWGFCCGRKVRDSLVDERYRVVIKSRFEPGTLKVGEYHLAGEREDCIVLCAHLCHPGQVNDGLSGVATGLAVMDRIAGVPRRYSYKLLITPETIGSVAWLSHNEEAIPSLIGGLFLEMTGLRQPPALQMSYFGDTQWDNCLRQVHLSAEEGAWCGPHRTIVGNDERQFNAPGVRVPMLSYSRSLPWEHPHRPFKEYHSPADNLEITSIESLDTSKDTVLAMVDAWESNDYPKNRFKGEICLANYNLCVDRHRNLTSHRQMLQMMDLIDGTNSVADIAERSQLPIEQVSKFLQSLSGAGLVDLPSARRSPRSVAEDEAAMTV